MKRAKLYSCILFALFFTFTWFVYSTSSLNQNGSICENAVVGAFAPWDSGCFYSAVFSEQNKPQQILYEAQKLDTFMSNQGFSHIVLWYRSLFLRKYAGYLKADFEKVDQSHWDYIRHDPSRIDIHLQYVEYVYRAKKNEFAQRSLDRYCSTYLNPQREYLIEGIVLTLKEKELELSIQTCIDAVTQSD